MNVTILTSEIISNYDRQLNPTIKPKLSHVFQSKPANISLLFLRSNKQIPVNENFQ